MRSSPRAGRRFWPHPLPATVLALLAAGAVVTATLSSPASGASGRRRTATASNPIGIVNAFGVEQAPILAEMRVRDRVDEDGFRFWVGTIGGRPVVDVASGEADEAAELATYVLDTRFHPRLVLFSGVAGSQNPSVHVGDVVVGAFVVDKSAVHYHLGGSQGAYQGEEVALTKYSDVRGDVITGYGETLPTPKDAADYGYGPGTANRHEVFVQAYAAPAEVVTTAVKAGRYLGTTTVANATGNPSRKGRLHSKVVAGVIGQADVWTSPLTWIEVQNLLYPSDAEENEASGFAFANAEAGVPWLVIRGISDTPWYPRADDSLVGADHAALVVKYLVGHLPATVSTTPATFGTLWGLANARRLGYLIAQSASYYVSSVPKVVYVDQKGDTVVLSGKRLSNIEKEYTYAAGTIRS